MNILQGSETSHEVPLGGEAEGGGCPDAADGEVVDRGGEEGVDELLG
jgi:hypothetical protein